MKNKNTKLGKMLIREFCVFSIAVICLYAAISFMIQVYNDHRIVNTLEKEYIVNCGETDSYEDIDVQSLKDIGGWFEVLDMDYTVVYPNIGRSYRSDEIIDIVNGDYVINGKYYRGILKKFNNTIGQERMQITFFPIEVLHMTPTINIPIQTDSIRFLGIYLLGGVLFVTGFVITVLVMSKKIKENITRPIDELKSAMRSLGNGQYTQRLNLMAEYEFVEMGTAFNSMAQAMENAVKKREEEEHLRRQLISDISHDIRTPLTVIQGYLITILNMKHVEEGRSYLERCYESSLEMKRLIDQLNDYNHLLRVDYKLELETVDLTEFVKSILADHYYQIDFAQMSLIVKLSDKKRMVCIDRHEMKRAIVNLINNAVQHNLSGTELFINIKDTEETYDLVIADSGVSLTKDVIVHMYEPFTKADQSRTNSEHNGLGLAIVKRVIEAHGFEILFRQPYQKYTKGFIIRISKTLEKQD